MPTKDSHFFFYRLLLYLLALDLTHTEATIYLKVVYIQISFFYLNIFKKKERKVDRQTSIGGLTFMALLLFFRPEPLEEIRKWCHRAVTYRRRFVSIGEKSKRSDEHSDCCLVCRLPTLINIPSARERLLLWLVSFFLLEQYRGGRQLATGSSAVCLAFNCVIPYLLLLLLYWGIRNGKWKGWCPFFLQTTLAGSL